MDLLNDDVGGTEDSTWDAIWSAAGRIDGDGYTVEIAIPLSSLRFPRTEGKQTWGLDALRFYPRSQRARISDHPLDRNVSCYLCQNSKITGFSGITPGRALQPGAPPSGPRSLMSTSGSTSGAARSSRRT
jgi:hypothetical protein